MSSITVLERKKNDIDLAVMSYSNAYSSCVENERLKCRNIGSSASQHVQPSLKSFKQQWVMYKLENCFSCFCEGKKYANQLTFDRVDIVINAKINYNMVVIAERNIIIAINFVRTFREMWYLIILP